MKIHCTFSLSNDVVEMLSLHKNKSEYIEKLIKDAQPSEKQKQSKIDYDNEIKKLEEQKSAQELIEESNKLKELSEREVAQKLNEYHARRRKFKWTEKSYQDYQNKRNNGIYESFDDYYCKEIEDYPK